MSKMQGEGRMTNYYSVVGDTLSNKVVDDLRGGGQLGYLEQDVREFIDELLNTFEGMDENWITKETIIKLAGRGLVKLEAKKETKK